MQQKHSLIRGPRNFNPRSSFQTGEIHSVFMPHLFIIPQFMTFNKWTFTRSKFIIQTITLAYSTPKDLPWYIVQVLLSLNFQETGSLPLEFSTGFPIDSAAVLLSLPLRQIFAFLQTRNCLPRGLTQTATELLERHAPITECGGGRLEVDGFCSSQEQTYPHSQFWGGQFLKYII